MDPAGAVAPRSTEDGSATWWPGLDGLRGVAVLAVLVYHHQAGRLPGGYLGVSLFFTLSGFLLTTLVLREHERTGAVSLRRFWSRRVRRLVPVSFVGLGVALVVTMVTVDAARVGQTIDDIRFAALDVANWRFAFRSVTYGDTLATPSPVLHYWSLAIEEQFYLVFPIVAATALRRGRRVFAVALALIVGASFARQLSIDDINRVYLGTDTRAAELAIGGLAAMGWTAYGHRLRSSLLDLLGGICAVGLGVMWVEVTLDTEALWRGGILGHAAMSAVVIVAVIGGRRLPAVAGLWPLRALGRVSYGVYAIHFPLFLLLSPDRVAVSESMLFLVRFVASVAGAVLIYWLIEAPIRWGGVLTGRQGTIAMATGLSSVNSEPAAETLAHTAVVTMPMPGAQQGSTVDPNPVVEGESPTSTPSDGSTTDTPSAGLPAPASTAPVPRLLVVGDSTAQANGAGMQSWASATGTADVNVVAQLACTFLLPGNIRLRDGWVTMQTPPCFNLLDDVVQAAKDLQPDAIVVFIGSMQLADWQLPGDPEFRGLGDPALDSPYLAAADAAMARLETVGVPILYADVATPDWDPAASGNGNFPGSGRVTINDTARAQRLNSLNATLITGHPLTRVISYAEHLQRADGTVDPAMRPDGLHLTHAAVSEIMRAWLAEELIAGYRSVTTAMPATLVRTTTWS